MLTAVPTFECLGLSWSPAAGNAGVTCAITYRAQGAAGWREAIPPWFDARNREYRGSIVGLQPGTAYEVQAALAGRRERTRVTVRTWSDVFPVVTTVRIPSGLSRAMFTATVSGVAGGWVLYAPASGESATIDVDGRAPVCVLVTASFAIVRGLVLKGAAKRGLELGAGVHDVVIEDCDISGWGRVDPDGMGAEQDAAIFSDDPGVRRIIIQHNRLHHPRANSNDWTQSRTAEGFHPHGPQAVVWFDSAGNHVIRWNEMYSDEAHRFNDGIGGAENFSNDGFPGPDSDIYGNVVSNVCDDALEIEGGGRNVRVWGNYLDQTFTGVASVVCGIGPLYIFRNVMNRSRRASAADTDLDGRGWFGKLGDAGAFGRGRRYFLHNTLLQERAPGKTLPLGAWGGPSPTGDGNPMTETVSLNNIWHTVWSDRYFCEDGHRNPGDRLDYDLFNGRLKAYAGAEAHGIRGVPMFRPGDGDQAGRSGRYALDPASPGYDAGIRLPNFNDGFLGAGPDIGAQESGAPPMRFGVDAAPR